MPTLIDNLIPRTNKWTGNITPHHTTGVLRFRVTHSYPVRVKGKGRIYSVTPSNVAFLGGVAMFDLIFLSHFSQKMGVSVLIGKEIS